MQRCVKRMISQAMFATSIACAMLACAARDGTSGLIVAPMTTAETDAATPEAGADAQTRADRAMPDEPRQPPNTMGCSRDVQCVDPEPVALTWALPAPFERCRPTLDKGAHKFSPAETRKQRRADSGEGCCYVAFEGCSRSMRREPID